MSFPDPVEHPFEAAQASADALAAATGVPHHDIAVVLGSGWKPAADQMGEVVAELPMTELGGFPEASVQGHGTTVRSIVNGDRRILAFMGRVHLYEGHHPNVVAHGVRTAVRAGLSSHRADQRRRRSAARDEARPAGAHRRPRQPHGSDPAPRAQRRPDRPSVPGHVHGVLAPAAGAGPIGGSHPGGGGLRRVPRPHLRDAGRGAHGGHAGRRAGGHVHGAWRPSPRPTPVPRCWPSRS